MTFGSTFGRTFSPSFQPKSQAKKGGGWWDLNGTITSCVAAYQPKGAASYAASKVNLANPGTYNAVDGTAYPTWDTSTGWKGNGASQYLSTGLPYNFKSAIVRFSGIGSNQMLFGAGRPDRQALGYGIGRRYIGGHYTGCSTAGVNSLWMSKETITSGIIGMVASPRESYVNGYYSNTWDDVGTCTGNIHILARENGSGVIDYYCSAYIAALAIYDSYLTSQNILDLTTAMAAL